MSSIPKSFLYHFSTQEDCIEALELSFWGKAESQIVVSRNLPICPECEKFRFFLDENDFIQDYDFFVCKNCGTRIKDDSILRKYQNRLVVKIEPYCPKCGSFLKTKAREGIPVLYQCKECKYQYNILSQTPFRYSKVELPIWFKSFWYLSRNYNDRRIAQMIGLNYRDAKNLIDKIQELDNKYVTRFMWKIWKNSTDYLKYTFSNKQPAMISHGRKRKFIKRELPQGYNFNNSEFYSITKYIVFIPKRINVRSLDSSSEGYGDFYSD